MSEQYQVNGGPKVLVLGTCPLSADVLTILHKHNDNLTIMLVENVENLAYRQELYQIIQSSDMIFVIADMRDEYSALLGSKTIDYCKTQKILAVPVLLMGSENDGADYIGQPGIISMTFEEMHQQCKLHPEIFSDNTDVISGIITAITDMFLASGLVGVDFLDVAAAFSLPGKLKPVFGIGGTVEEAVKDLLISVDESETKANVISLLSFYGSSSRKSFLKDVHKAITILENKGLKKSHEDFAAAVAVVPDDLLADKVKVFALMSCV